MKKKEQTLINIECGTHFKEALDELENNVRKTNWKRLRNCKAEVIETLNYYILRSYDTIVAVIDTRSDTLYDYLRCVYCYTATSAQHISKFNHDYGYGKWGCLHTYRYYDC